MASISSTPVFAAPPSAHASSPASPPETNVVNNSKARPQYSHPVQKRPSNPTLITYRKNQAASREGASPVTERDTATTSRIAATLEACRYEEGRELPDGFVTSRYSYLYPDGSASKVIGKPFQNRTDDGLNHKFLAQDPVSRESVLLQRKDKGGGNFVLEISGDKVEGGNPARHTPEFSKYWAAQIQRENQARFFLQDWTSGEGLFHLSYGHKGLCLLDMVQWRTLTGLQGPAAVNPDFELFEHPVQKVMHNVPGHGEMMVEIHSGGGVLCKDHMLEIIRQNRPKFEQFFEVDPQTSDEDILNNHVIPFVRERKDQGDFDHYSISSILFRFGQSNESVYNPPDNAPQDLTENDEIDRKVAETHRQLEDEAGESRHFSFPGNPNFVKANSAETWQILESDTGAGKIMFDKMNSLAKAHPDVADGSDFGRGKLLGSTLLNTLFVQPAQGAVQE